MIADVDADGHAEIVAPWMDTTRTILPQVGVQVYGSGRWEPTRRIWNQYGYYITNVNDDGTIPRVEQSNLETHNNFRVNAALAGVRHYRAYLPLVLNEHEQSVKPYAEIVLAVDASSSMAGIKLAAAKEAIRQFLGQMTWPDDHVAIVTFNHRATLIQELTVSSQQVGAGAPDGLAW